MKSTHPSDTHARLSEFFPFLEPFARAALPPWLTPLELTGTKPMTVIVMANKFSERHEAIFQIQNRKKYPRQGMRRKSNKKNYKQICNIIMYPPPHSRATG